MKKQISYLLISVLAIICAFMLTSCFGDSTEALSDVSGIEYSAEEGKISWGAVNHAGQYKVKINDNTEELVVGTSYAYNANEQNFKVSITAVPQEQDVGIYSESQEVIKTFTFLSKVDNIRMEDGYVSWNSVNNATYYKVYLNGEYVGTVQETKYENLTANVSYQVQIVPGNEGSSATGYYGVKSNTFSGLVVAKPTLKFENATTMVYWDAIDGAEGYQLILSLNGKTIKSETFGSSTTSYVNSFVDAGTYKIQVQTKSDKTRTDQYDSAFAEIEVIRLPMVGDVKTSYPTTEANNTIFVSFDDIPNATGFEVKEGKVTLKQQSKTTFEYTFVRSVEEVTKDLVIYTKGDGNRILDSYSGKTVTLTKLAMPQNIKVNNGLIVWDAVAKNDGYRVVIDGNEFLANANQLELPTLQGGSHNVSIAALGNGEAIVSSDFSNSVKIIKLQTPQNLHIKDNVLYWENVQYCESYLVQIDELEQVVGTNSFAIDSSYIGQNTTIKVTAIANGENIISSNYSETKALFRLSAPKNLKTNNDYVSWSAVPNVTHYEIYFNNTVKIVTGESYSWEEFPAKDYIVKVVAVGDGSTYFTSLDSTELNVKKLDAPVVNITENAFEWTKVQMASAYEILDQEEVHTTDGMTLKYQPAYTTTGKKILQFRAVGNGVNTVTSSWTTVEHMVTQESVPGSFTVTRNGSQFTITVDNPVDGKTYLFDISGTVKQGEVSQSVTIGNAGSFNVSVATKGDGFNTVNSTYSASKEYAILNKIQSTDIQFLDEGDDYYTVSWKGVSNAFGYTLKIQKTRDDGTVEEEIIRQKTSAETNHGISMQGYKSVKITVIVKGNGEYYFDSEETSKVFEKL